MVRKVRPNGEATVVQEVFGLCAVSSGTEAGGPLQTKKQDTKENGEMFNIIFKIGEERVPDRNARGREVGGGQETSFQEKVQEAEGGI